MKKRKKKEYLCPRPPMSSFLIIIVLKPRHFSVFPFPCLLALGQSLPHIVASIPVGHRILVYRHAVFQNSRIRSKTQLFMLFRVLLLSLSPNCDTRKEGYVGVLRIQFIGIHVDIWVFSTLNHQRSGEGQDQESSLRNRWAMSGLQVQSVL